MASGDPNGADPVDTLRKLFQKHDLTEELLDKFLTPKDTAGDALTVKINSPEKFWKLGVDNNEKRKVLAAVAGQDVNTGVGSIIASALCQVWHDCAELFSTKDVEAESITEHEVLVFVPWSFCELCVTIDSNGASFAECS